MKGPLIWNLTSFVGIALVGVLLNVLIGMVYDASALGVFNQAVTLYIFASQLAVLGVHHFVLQRVSLAVNGEGVIQDHGVVGAALWASLTSAAALGSLVTAVAMLTIDGVSLLFDSSNVGLAWTWTAPALVFFALNKVLLATLNALSWFRLFASFNLSRYLLLLISMLAYFALEVDPNLFASIFLVSEVVLFVALLPTVLFKARPAFPSATLGGNIADAIRFGAKSAVGGALSEFNTKVDIFVLGVFLDDAKVGIYSIVALIFEGLSQFATVVRNLLNPQLARGLAEEDKAELQVTVKTFVRRTTAALGVLSLVTIGLYSPFVDWVLQAPIYHDGFSSLVVLVSGLTLCAGLYTLDMLFVQGNRPGTQTLFKLAIVSVNLAANFALVPLFGILGAAVGTVLSLVFGYVFLNVLGGKLFAMRVLPI